MRNIIDAGGFQFDDYFFKSGAGSTLDFKMGKILEIIETYRPEIIFFYDDRTDHIPSFRKLGDEIFDEHGIDFKLFHVTSSFSGYELKYNSKLR